jgi:hypothetical protein
MLTAEQQLSRHALMSMWHGGVQLMSVLRLLLACLMWVCGQKSSVGCPSTSSMCDVLCRQ